MVIIIIIIIMIYKMQVSGNRYFACSWVECRTSGWNNGTCFCSGIGIIQILLSYGSYHYSSHNTINNNTI